VMIRVLEDLTGERHSYKHVLDQDIT